MSLNVFGSIFCIWNHNYHLLDLLKQNSFMNINNLLIHCKFLRHLILFIYKCRIKMFNYGMLRKIANI